MIRKTVAKASQLTVKLLVPVGQSIARVCGMLAPEKGLRLILLHTIPDIE